MRRDTDLRPGLRSFPIANYVIFYRVESDGSVLILRVLHGSRDLPVSIAALAKRFSSWLVVDSGSYRTTLFAVATLSYLS
jgi:hypothetical protein